MDEQKIIIIVLNWNGRDLTLRCLHSLQRIDYANVSVLVVDNGSDDDSVAAINKVFPTVEVIALPENLGYARGNNAGLGIALKQSPDWVMFLNNDTEVDKDVLSAFVVAAERFDDVGILGPKIYYGSGEQIIWYAGGKLSMPLGLIKHRGIREYDRGQYDDPGRTDFVSGCCLMIRGDLVRQLGGFNPVYSMYHEDLDLCYRAHQLGAANYYVPEATVWHHVSSSLGGELSLRKVWLKWRSGMRFFGLYAKPWHWITILFSQILYYTVLGPIRYAQQRWFRVS
jgi:GT2 family glycosyltransferase